MLKDFIPPYDATIIDKISEQDALIIGKTNMDEYAMGTTTETSYFGTTKNPWNLKKVPGGSSGGSAAAVAAQESAASLGSDTGGSIRCPASFCSIVGLKPTYGLVSRYGLISYADSLEQIGPLTKDVRDCALMLSVISGYDTKDSTSLNVPQKNYLSTLSDEINGVKIGIPQEFFGDGLEEEVKKDIWKSIDQYENLGAVCEKVFLPSLKYALAAYYIIAMSEASSNLARYDGLRYGYSENNTNSDWITTYKKNRMVGFGTEVKRRIILGSYSLSAGYYDQYYLKALKIRTLIRQDFDRSFKKFDVLIGPTMPVCPFDIGSRVQNPLSLYMCDVLTVPANLIGYPAISIPCGINNKLPIGLQIIGKPLEEEIVLKTAYAFECKQDKKRLELEL
jgi:aspartyl-tRNA(Asn)/glutamyl-tRNA(Gln) amidotransferase subunit A